MAKPSVRDLRYRSLESRDPAKRPDFLARLKKIYGSKTLKVSGAALLAKDRGRH